MQAVCWEWPLASADIQIVCKTFLGAGRFGANHVKGHSNNLTVTTIKF